MQIDNSDPYLESVRELMIKLTHGLLRSKPEDPV